MVQQDPVMITEDLLEYHRAAREKIAHLPPAQLSWEQNAIVWGLRLYVVVMIAVVGLEVIGVVKG